MYTSFMPRVIVVCDNNVLEAVLGSRTFYFVSISPMRKLSLKFKHD
jgi:hypothetical protein